MVKLYKLFEPKESAAAESSRAEDDLSPAQVVQAEMKSLFKSKRRTPPDILAELSKSLRELKLILYGNNSEAEPVAEACAQLTLEFFKDATQVVANLQRQQQVNSRLVASDYLESNTDLMDVLVDGYGVTLSLESAFAIRLLQKPLPSPFPSPQLALHVACPSFASVEVLFASLASRSPSLCGPTHCTGYNEEGAMGSGCIRFTSTSTLATTIRTHLSVFGWSFTNFPVVLEKNVSPASEYRYPGTFTKSTHNGMALFVANQKKPSDIINALVANRNKLLRLLADLKLDKEDENFEADKAHVVSGIASLKPGDLA
ncbi:hypothetical protein F2Q70_00035303 [Brassica cretica]|uniref:Uncharacterized protein n=1 Tax=Brassica cretica TaxID=69181 RepID=A0A8S9JZZ9_BRACR|nr:hypothetical protein F2Q70_00035303 [Brassica cretica]